MDGFSVVSEKFVAAGAGVGQVAVALQREIATMDDILGEITAGWRSDQAAPRYAAAMQGHLDQVRVITRALLSHGETLTGTGRQYDQAESALAQAIPGVA